MTKPELTKACAKAMGYKERDDSDDEFINGIAPDGLCVINHDAPPISQVFYYDPLHDNAQCFALALWLSLRGTLSISFQTILFTHHTSRETWDWPTPDNAAKRRAICECVARMKKL